jgi:hypothetical protein
VKWRMAEMVGIEGKRWRRRLKGRLRVRAVR